jgi:hypothetical protein
VNEMSNKLVFLEVAMFCLVSRASYRLSSSNLTSFIAIFTKLFLSLFVSDCRFPKISIRFISSSWNSYTNCKYYILFLDDPTICDEPRTSSKKVGR